ncbi:hypothetical protein IQ07DRAFT_128673 [Pyrenochaeta sp. DS3sAY3a]|nr:hypothetical protein IQ07DRAFT_128673 [Pyrenochaeta sp. DS3sAY3a]
MSNHFLLIACLIAICLPILSVQLPRLALLKPHTRSNDAATEKQPPTLSRPQPLRRRTRTHMSQTDGASASPSPDCGAQEGGEERVRKPWDPPFPRGRAQGRMRWLILPGVGSERKSEGEEEQGGVVEDTTPGDVHGESGAFEARRAEVEPQNQDPASISIVQHAPSQKKPSATSVVCLMLGVLGFILFLLAYAILIAHCLAWFLVYKTEARLGEARRGLLKGGEMRLCLCAS